MGLSPTAVEKGCAKECEESETMHRTGPWINGLRNVERP
ncbi:hypothetical protein SynA1524_01045 [Synechococcus sp. A15-24]|nr:hypothetical protein SynA1524_01045 [Synechococcus sp. A15-24]